MKKHIKIKNFLLILILSFSMFGYGQMLAPEDPGGEPEGPPLGGSAPVGGGAVLFVLLSAGYGIVKIVKPKLVIKEE